MEICAVLQAAKGKAKKKAVMDSDDDAMSMSDDSGDSDFEAATKKVSFYLRQEVMS